MFSFANPEALYLLLIIPALLGLYLLARLARRNKIKRYGNPDILKEQMPDVSDYKPWIKISLQLLAVMLIVIVIARPRALGNSKAETVNVQGIEVMVALDVSNSMLASSTDDPEGVSRLQKSKLILEKLIDKLGNDKVGLIVFAGDAYTQIPITADFVRCNTPCGGIVLGLYGSCQRASGAFGLCIQHAFYLLFGTQSQNA